MTLQEIDQEIKNRDKCPYCGIDNYTQEKELKTKAGKRQCVRCNICGTQYMIESEKEVLVRCGHDD